MKMSGGASGSNRAVGGSIMAVIRKLYSYKNLYSAEFHILLFKRPLGTDPRTGAVSEEAM